MTREGEGCEVRGVGEDCERKRDERTTSISSKCVGPMRIACQGGGEGKHVRIAMTSG